MNIRDKIELAAIAGLTGGAYLLSGYFADQMEPAYILVVAALIFLIQSLIRDLVILSRRSAKNGGSTTEQRCMCLESGIGFAPVMIAAGLVLAGIRNPVPLAPWVWPVLIGSTLMLGFLTKDFVVNLKTGRIRKEKDHMNIIFRWNSE